jgi:hypothetical protein
MYTLQMPTLTYGYDLFYDTWYLLIMIVNGWNAYMASTAGNKYYYNVAHNASMAMMKFFVWGDKVFSAKYIQPSKPWNRYA